MYVYITCTGNFLRSHGASVNVVCAAFNAFLTFLLSKRIFIFILFVFIRLRHVVGHLLCETVHARPIGPILITPRLNSVICTCNNDNFLPLSLSLIFFFGDFTDRILISVWFTMRFLSLWFTLTQTCYLRLFSYLYLITASTLCNFCRSVWFLLVFWICFC